MAVTYAPLSAYNASVSINGQLMKAQKWTVNYRADDIDASNFEGSGYEEWIRGLTGADVTIEFLWDVNNNPINGIASLVPGFSLNSVKLFLDTLVAPASFWEFPALFVTSVSLDAEVRGAIRVTVSGKADGLFFEPN